MHNYNTENKVKRAREWTQLSAENEQDFFDALSYDMTKQDFHQVNSKVHAHTFYQILWIHEGKGQHEIDYVAHEVVPDEMVFLAPWQVHRNIVEESFKMTVINFSKSFMNSLDSKIVSYLNMILFGLVREQSYCNISAECVEALRPIAEKMVREQEAMKEEERDLDILQQKLNLMQFVLTFMRFNPQLPDMEVSRDDLSLYEQFTLLVRDNFGKLRNVQEYQDKLCVSYYKLAQACKVCVNKTPSSYISDYIFEEAKRMLARSNKSIKEIYADLGFEDAPSFSKFFWRKGKISPSDFRKQYAKVEWAVS